LLTTGHRKEREMATNSDRHVKMFGQQLVRRHPLLPRTSTPVMRAKALVQVDLATGLDLYSHTAASPKSGAWLFRLLVEGFDQNLGGRAGRGRVLAGD